MIQQVNQITFHPYIGRCGNKAKMDGFVPKKRGRLWVNDHPKAVKLGDYPVFSLEGISYSGLENNIAFQNNGQHVLVMDNHNYSAAFIIDLLGRGVIKPDSKMAHVDAHLDLQGSDFSTDYYSCSALFLEEDRHEYLLRTTTVGSWQVEPLFKSGIVDQSEWTAIALWKNDHQWKGIRWSPWQSENWKMSENPYYSFDELHGVFDIVDIDIDVFMHLDRTLSEEERENTSKGMICERIRSRIDVLADFAKPAKAVTIALSPGYMDQGRSMVYAVELLRGMGHLM
ncbi:hypothetical protein ACFLZ2_01880 [Candidatus Margulisiibacteriota bacterium]